MCRKSRKNDVSFLGNFGGRKHAGWSCGFRLERTQRLCFESGKEEFEETELERQVLL